MTIQRWTRAERADLALKLAELQNRATYRDTRTGFVGRVSIPETEARVIRAPNGMPKLPLTGASPKDDRIVETRFAFIEHLELVGPGAPAVGFDTTEV